MGMASLMEALAQLTRLSSITIRCEQPLAPDEQQVQQLSALTASNRLQ